MGRTIRVDIKPEVLAWVIEGSGRKTRILDQMPMLERWLSGERKPTLNQLEDLARKAYVPLGVLFLDEPPVEKLPIPHYRTFGDVDVGRPSRNLLDTVRMMQDRQSWLREYLLEDGADPKEFVGLFSSADDTVMVANHIRRTLGLSLNWASETQSWDRAFTKLFECAEDVGIMVVRNGIVGNNTSRGLDPEEFRGFVLVDEIAPLVFINGADFKAAQMFSFAHELAHIWLGASAVFDLSFLQPADDEIERICNAIAAEFLVPAATMLNEWGAFSAPDYAISELAQYFKVSSLVVARRATDLGLVHREFFYQFYRDYLGNLRRDPSVRKGGDFFRTQKYRIGNLFFNYVQTALKEGRLLYRDAYKLTGLNGNTFSNCEHEWEGM